MFRFEQLEQFALDHYEARRLEQHNVVEVGRQRNKLLSFHKLLKAFVSGSQLSDAFFLADMKNMLVLAKLLRHLEPHLGLSDMYSLCISPASADDGPVVQVSRGQSMRTWCVYVGGRVSLVRKHQLCRAVLCLLIGWHASSTTWLSQLALTAVCLRQKSGQGGLGG